MMVLPSVMNTAKRDRPIVAGLHPHAAVRSCANMSGLDLPCTVVIGDRAVMAPDPF